MPRGSGDRWPDDYERGRPGYSGDAVDVVGVPASSSVLDLGAGTGKLTRVLLTRFARVSAVEPADAMRLRLAELCPDAEAFAGSAEEISLPDASVDAVFSAESFHWFDGERALAEIARVLRPSGALALMWNVPAGPSFVALLASMGWVADLPDDERLPLLDTMRSLLDADEYVRPWKTLVYWTRVG